MTAPLNPLNRIRPDVRAMHAYTVQSADGLLKMDAMENPFGLPPHLQAALGIVDRGEDQVGLTQELMALVGQGHSLGVPTEQADADVLLQLLDRQGQG